MWNRTGDFNFHFEKARQTCTKEFGEQRCDSYYPLLHLLGQPFSFSKNAFFSYLTILIVFLTPLILFFVTKKWFSVWLYFAATQYVYLVQTGGAYPQALAGIFLIIFLATKNHLLRLPLLVLASLSHSQTFNLLVVIWLIELFFENWSSIKSVFPACSAIFGKQATDPIGERINLDVVNKHGIQNINIPIKDLANFFVRIFPLPFLIMAFWQIRKEKKWALIVITVFALYYGIAVQQARIFYIVPLILIPPLTNFYSELDSKWKKWFVLLTIITFVINFGTWIMFKWNCVSLG